MERTAVEIAADVRSGGSSALVETRAALERMAGDDVGAFQIVRSEHALAEAAGVDARGDRAALPLAGVPVAIKDNIPVAGEPLRDGSAATDATPQQRDHEVVARLRAAGAVVVGITKVPELCVFGATDSVYGITRNPWNRDRTSGGSSGGSAAAVASGFVPIAHGNDGMGSIRIPAANCGLVGLKPGSGLVPQDIGVDAWFGMSENGPLATTVADAALMLSVLAGRSDLADVREPDAPLRIAVAPGAASPLAPVDPEWVRGLRETAETLSRAGHSVTEAVFPYPSNPIPLLARWFAGTETDAALLDRRLLEPRIRTHARWGRVLGRAARDPRPVEKFRAAATEFFGQFDVLITPSLAQPGIPAIDWHRESWFANMKANIRYAPFASPWNLLGWPAASIPAGWHEAAGVPLGVQLVAPPRPDGAGEALVLSLAAQLERLRPWPRTVAER
ncbi:amidase [Schumannella luteola]